MFTAKDYDCSRYFGDNAMPTSKPPETVQIKLRADRQETEEFYLTVSPFGPPLAPAAPPSSPTVLRLLRPAARPQSSPQPTASAAKP
jgi:hypothetical protein